jgi:hypothetical protein
MKSSEPKQVLAIEYNGSLYPDLAAAETSRARQALHELLPKLRDLGDSPYVGLAPHYAEMERRNTIDQLLKNPREVAAVFAKVVAAMGDKR